MSTKDGVLVARHENEIGGTTDVAAHPELASRRTTKSIDGSASTGWFTEDFTFAELQTLRAKERIPAVRPANTAYDGRYGVPSLRGRQPARPRPFRKGTDPNAPVTRVLEGGSRSPTRSGRCRGPSGALPLGTAPNLASSKGFEGMALSPDGRTLYPPRLGPAQRSRSDRAGQSAAKRARTSSAARAPPNRSPSSMRPEKSWALRSLSAMTFSSIVSRAMRR